MAVTDVYDATTGNVQNLPPGALAAGYDTGPGVAWTPEQWAAHPGALHYDQDPAASDTTADLLDVEAGAATALEAANWKKRAQAKFEAKTRPGQREPAIYCSGSKMTGIVNALLAGGVTSCPFVIAAYPGGDLAAARAAAAAIIEAANGPFPVVGRQYADLGDYDANVFRNDWLATGGNTPPPPSPAPAGNWTETLVNSLPTLAEGAASDDVRTMQGALIARRQPVTVDGVFGPATKTALQAFQRSAGLTADGITGPATWPKLLGR